MLAKPRSLTLSNWVSVGSHSHWIRICKAENTVSRGMLLPPSHSEQQVGPDLAKQNHSQQPVHLGAASMSGRGIAVVLIYSLFHSNKHEGSCKLIYMSAPPPTSCSDRHCLPSSEARDCFFSVELVTKIQINVPHECIPKKIPVSTPLSVNFQ